MSGNSERPRGKITCGKCGKELEISEILTHQCRNKFQEQLFQWNLYKWRRLGRVREQ